MAIEKTSCHISAYASGVRLRVRDHPTAEIETFNRKRMKPHETLSKAWHGNEHYLCSNSIPKAAAAGPRQGDGLRGGRRGRPHRAAPWQSHLVVSLAQRVVASADMWPMYRARPDRHGRFRQAALQWPRFVSLSR